MQMESRDRGTDRVTRTLFPILYWGQGTQGRIRALVSWLKENGGSEGDRMGAEWAPPLGALHLPCPHPPGPCTPAAVYFGLTWRTSLGLHGSMTWVD